MQQLLASPMRGAASAAGTTAASPAINRLDRILELVTDHEANYRDQDIKLAQMTQKMGELEMRMQQELAAVWALKERNIPQELDLARTAVETVVRQLAAVTKTNQMLQSELKACQQKQQQQQVAFESTIAVLQSDIAALRSKLCDTQDNTRAAVEQLRTGVNLQLEKQQQELEEQMQSLQRESVSAITLLRQDTAARASGAVRELESWSKTELLQMAAQVKAVVSGCTNHQQQVNLQMEALQQQWENTSSAMDGLQAEDKRIKKHVVRLQDRVEELQRLSQQAVTSEVALQQVRHDVQQITAQQQQLSTRLEVTSNASSSLLQRAADSDQQLAAVNSRLASYSADLAKLAESVGNCLAAARADAAAAAAAAPSSYLSTLLAPAGAGSAAAQVGRSSTGGSTGRRTAKSTVWDDHLAEFDEIVGRLRRKATDTEFLRATSPHKHSSYTVDGSSNSSRYLTQQRHTSPGRLSSGTLRALLTSSNRHE